MQGSADNPHLKFKASQLPLVDTHCHLDLSQFDEDRDEVVARAKDAGVELIINPGIDLAHSRQALALADRYPCVYAAVGIHPNSADTFNSTALATLREMATHPKVVAIGEIGLDYYWDKVTPAQQKQALEAQLLLATDLGLPVIIHSRESNEDVAAILRQWVNHVKMVESRVINNSVTKNSGKATQHQLPLLGVLHAYSGDLKLAEEAYDWRFVLSLGGPVTFKNARALHALVPQLRLDRLMLETDAPYLTPHPYRGKRNEPAQIALICQQIARLCTTTPETVQQVTSTVALRFYGLEKMMDIA